MRLESGSQTLRTTQDLLPERPFARALQRERQRCDRCGAELALIRLELPRAAHEPVLGSILARVRATDELGWLAPGALGILLPETDAEGARVLVDDLRAADPSGLLRRCAIALYFHPEPRPARLGRRVRTQPAPIA